MNKLLSIFDTVTHAEAGADLHLKHPATGRPVYLDADKAEPKKPLIIKLKGIDSREFEREAERRLRESKADSKKDDVTLQQSIAEACQTYAKLTIGWINIPGDDGKELEFSYDAAVKLYTDYKDIRVQVSNFIANKANFIKA